MDQQKAIQDVEKKYSQILQILDYEEIAVLGNSGTANLPAVAFTVGGARRGMPDLIMYGIELPDSISITNTAFDVVKEQWPFPSKTALAGVVEGRDVAFRDVSRSDLLNRMLFLVSLFNTRNGYPQTPILQICWPDNAGRFPYEPGCDRAVASLQRIASLRN